MCQSIWSARVLFHPTRTALKVWSDRINRVSHLSCKHAEVSLGLLLGLLPGIILAHHPFNPERIRGHWRALLDMLAPPWALPVSSSFIIFPADELTAHPDH